MLFSLPKARFALLLGALALTPSFGSLAQPKQPARSAASKTLKGWKPFSSKVGGFSALFPATPRTMDRSQGKFKVHAIFHAIPGGAYMVTYSDMRESGFTKSQIQSFSPQGMLDSNRKGLLIGSRGTLVSEKRLNWQGFPARDVVYDIPQLGVSSRCLLIFARPFLYQVMTIAPKKPGSTSTPTVRAFLDSFQIRAARP